MIARFRLFHGCMLLLAASLAACVQSAVIKDVAEVEVREVSIDKTSKPILFKKVVVKLRRGEKYGAWSWGLFCIPQGELRWRGSKTKWDDDELIETFQEELSKANYEVVGDPNALFDDPTAWRAQYLVAGIVKDLRMNICFPFAKQGDLDTAQGEAYMKVDWQIYHRLDRRVVHKVSTEGSYKEPSWSAGGGFDAPYNAFAQATRGLIADEKFHNLVAGAAAQAETQAETQTSSTSGRVRLRKPALLAGALTSNMARISKAVVTVFAGTGHGSGFFIDRRGYLLTNRHVVGNATVVKIKFSDQKEITGRVIARDARRDVALVKIKVGPATPLPIKFGRRRVGSDVYAVGSPLDEDLDLTVSKGIISAYRTEDGMPFIQSDTNINPGNSGGPLLDVSGNVIGISVTIAIDSGQRTGIAFFIPIEDALKILNITRG